MAEENVQALEAVYERWARGDFWTPEIFAADAHVVWAQDMPDFPREDVGVEAAERGMRNLLAAYAQYTWEAERFIPVGDRVVVVFTARGRGRGSSLEIDAQWAHVWTFRDGKATRVEGFLDPREALESVGLSNGVDDARQDD